MEEIMFSISVLRSFVQRREFFLGVYDGVGRSNFFQVWSFRPCFAGSILDDFCWLSRGGFSLQYLSRILRPRQSWLYSRLTSDVDQAVRFVFPGILVLVLLPLLYDYSNGGARARNLGTAAKIKILGEPSLVFIGLWFGTYVCLCGCLRKSTRLSHGRRTTLKTSMIC
jgi:hypothetical protein